MVYPTFRCIDNGPFKKILHHWDSDCRINHLNTKKPDYYEIIDAIVNLWYDETKMTTDMIILLITSFA